MNNGIASFKNCMQLILYIVFQFKIYFNQCNSVDNAEFHMEADSNGFVGDTQLR